jgi:hypothetical protein
LNTSEHSIIDFSDSFDESPVDLGFVYEDKLITLPVNKIYFLQDTISSYFHDGTSIHSKKPKEITILEVLYDQGDKKLFSINNRSLYVLKKNKVHKIACKIKLKKNNLSIYERHNVNSNGTKIEIVPNLEFYKNELLTINKVSQTGITSDEWFKHKINFSKNNILSDEIKTFDEHTEKTFIGKKRQRSLLDMFEILKKSPPPLNK